MGVQLLRIPKPALGNGIEDISPGISYRFKKGALKVNIRNNLGIRDFQGSRAPDRKSFSNNLQLLRIQPLDH